MLGIRFALHAAFDCANAGRWAIAALLDRASLPVCASHALTTHQFIKLGRREFVFHRASTDNAILFADGLVANHFGDPLILF